MAEPDSPPPKTPIEFQRVTFPESPFSLDVCGKDDDVTDQLEDKRVGDGLVDKLISYEHDRVGISLVRLTLDADTADKDNIFSALRELVLSVSFNGYTDLQDLKKVRTPEIQKLPTMRMTFFEGNEKGDRYYVRFVAVRKDRDVFAFWAVVDENDTEAVEAVKKMENSIRVKM